MKYISLVLLAVGAVILSGCTTISEKNIENSKQLRVGMTKSRVLEIMGQPLTEEEFNTPDVWYYYIETVWLDGLTTRDECMPVVFEKGKLVGWGNRFYTLYRSTGVRNAREIDLTGEFAEAQAKDAEEKKSAAPAAAAEKSEKAEAAKPAPAPAVRNTKPAGPKKPVTVDDLVTEMENKK